MHQPAITIFRGPPATAPDALWADFQRAAEESADTASNTTALRRYLASRSGQATFAPRTVCRSPPTAPVAAAAQIANALRIVLGGIGV